LRAYPKVVCCDRFVSEATRSRVQIKPRHELWEPEGLISDEFGIAWTVSLTPWVIFEVTVLGGFFANRGRQHQSSGWDCRGRLVIQRHFIFFFVQATSNILQHLHVEECGLSAHVFVLYVSAEALRNLAADRKLPPQRNCILCFLRSCHRTTFMSLVSGPGRGGAPNLPTELHLAVDKHVRYIQTLDTVRRM
jgi:hypothetical protein